MVWGAKARHISTIKPWIGYAETTRAIMDAEGSDRSPEDQLNECARHNVEVQANHLKTYPTVAAQLSISKLSIHGWFYHIEAGDI